MPRDLFAEAGVDPKAPVGPRDLFAEAGMNIQPPVQPSPVKALADVTAGAFFSGAAGLTQKVADTAKYIGEKTGIAKITDFLGIPHESTILQPAAERVQARAARDLSQAEAYGAGPVTRFVGEALGGAVPGITEFVAGVPFAGVSGAAEAEKQGEGAGGQLLAGAKSAAERFALGKIFEGITIGRKAFGNYSDTLLKKYGVNTVDELSGLASSQEINTLNDLGARIKHFRGIAELPLAGRIPAMAATFGGQTVADAAMAGKKPETADIAKAAGTGALYAFLGGGRPSDVAPAKVADKNFTLSGEPYSEPPSSIYRVPYPVPKNAQKLLPPGEGGATFTTSNSPEPPAPGTLSGPQALLEQGLTDLRGRSGVKPAPPITPEGPVDPWAKVRDQFPPESIGNVPESAVQPPPVARPVVLNPAAGVLTEQHGQTLNLGLSGEVAAPKPGLSKMLTEGAATEAAISRHRLEKVLKDQGIMPGTPEYESILKEHRQVAREYDRVTGYQPGDYLDQAIGRVQKSNGESSYGAIDLRNLGGLNEHFGGEEKTNPTLSEIASVIKNTVDSEIGKHAQWFRKGGDEFSVIAEGVSQKKLESALKKASDAVDVYSQDHGLSNISHPKGKNPGTGIYFGSSDFASKTAKETITAAENRLYEQKTAAHETPSSVTSKLSTKAQIRLDQTYKAFLENGYQKTVQPKTPAGEENLRNRGFEQLLWDEKTNTLIPSPLGIWANKREATNAETVRGNEGQVRKGGAGGQPEVQRGAEQGGGDLQLAAQKETINAIDRERATQEEVKQAVENSGAIYNGIQNDSKGKPSYFLFTDKETKSTIGLPVDRATPEEINKVIQAKRHEFKSANNEPLQTSTYINPAIVPVRDVPVESIHLSKDVPNFKENASEATGVVAGHELQGKQYERLGTGPIVVWKRLNGKLEIITGRHRLDLAKRLGEKTIPTQTVSEADGFTKKEAITFDAEANIRDGQGRTEDYAHYFKYSPQLTEEDARSRGLLDRAKGKAGFDLGKHASDDVYTLWRNGQINEDQALAITHAAPDNAQAQEIGVKYAREGKPASYVSNIIRVALHDSGGNAKNLDLFGHDDSAIKSMEDQAKRASSFQREIKDQIAAVNGASKRPEAARRLGVDVKDPEAVKAKVTELKVEAAKWDNWPSHPDLVEKVRGEGAPDLIAEKLASYGMPEMQNKLTAINKLSNEVDKAYESGDTKKAEDLDARLAQDREDLESYHAALQETEGAGDSRDASLSELLAGTYAEVVTGRSGSFPTLKDAAVNFRSSIEMFGTDTSKMTDDKIIEVAKDSFDAAMARRSKIKGVAKKPEASYNVSHEDLSVTARENLPGQQAGSAGAGAIPETRGTSDFQLTPPVQSKKPAPPQSRLDLGQVKGEELRAPDRINKPVNVNELELGKATNAAADRAAQPGLFDEMAKADNPEISVIGKPKVEVVHETIGHFQSDVTRISGPADVAHIASELANSPQEKFIMVIADKNNRVISVLNYSMGSQSASIVHPMAMGRVLSIPGAKKVWFAHNHPSGDPRPSQEDLLLTKRLRQVLDAINIDYSGHVIIGSTNEWMELPNGQKGGEGFTLAEGGARPHKIPIIERKFKTKEGGSKTISSSQDVREFGSENLPDGGIALLNTKNQPVTLLTLPDSLLKMDGPLSASLMREIEKANASAMIIYSPKRTLLPGEASTMKAFSELVGTQFLDIVDTKMSWRDNGMIAEARASYDTPFASATDEKLNSLIKEASADKRDTFAKVFEAGRREFESGKTKYADFVTAMKERMGSAWDKLKEFVRKAWNRIKAINEKLGERGSIKWGDEKHGTEKPSQREAPTEKTKETSETESRIKANINEAKAKVDEYARKADNFTDRSSFIREDVKPVMQAAVNGFSAAWDGLKRAINPMSRSDAAQEAGRIIIEGMGKKERATDVFRAKLDSITMKFSGATKGFARILDLMQTSTGLLTDRVFNKMSKLDKYAFMQNMDTGGEQMIGGKKNAELTALAGAVKEMFDAKVKAVQDLGTGALQQVRENYFPHIWKTKLTEEQIASIMSKRPAEGSKAFTKQRVFDDFIDGLKAGYEPITDNPLDLVFLKMHEMDKYINTHTALQEMSGKGVAKLIPVGDDRPRGYEDLQKPYGIITKIDGNKYRYIVQEDVAQVFNNYLSQNLYNNKYIGGIFTGYMGAANWLNKFQLGVFSAFHAGFTSMESMISHGALGVKALAEGDLKGATKYFIETPAAIWKNPKLGSDIIKAWYGNAAAGKEMPQMIQWLEMAGARKSMDNRFMGDITKSTLQAWSSGNKIGAALRSPLALVEQSARPILEWLVPRQKFGVFGELANSWSERNPNATHEETRAAMQKIWNRVDSRLGQVVYDRLFIHNVSKNVVQALMRAPGWTGGTIVEIGGGFVDMKDAFKAISKGQKPVMTDRMAYTVSMVLTTAIINGLVTKALTGDNPEDLDFLAFRTGSTDTNGNAERFIIPTYAKDLYHYTTAPGQTILNKTHPLISLFGELIKNRGYYGVEVRHVGDPLIKQTEEIGLHVAKAFVPFWMRGASQAKLNGDSIAAMAAPLVGIMPASSDMMRTPAQRKASELLHARTPSEALTKEQYDKSRLKHDLANRMSRKDPRAASDMQMAVSEGKLNHRDVLEIRRNSNLTPLQRNVKHLTYDEAKAVYGLASDAEKSQITHLVEKKQRNLSSAEKQ